MIIRNALYGDIEYSILDPTGNITALAETQVEPKDQPAVAAEIMGLNPDVEQVGFVTFADADGFAENGGAAGGQTPAPDGAAVRLRMAGGEFCGNAAMSAAALYMFRAGLSGELTVNTEVSGAKEPLEVRLDRTGAVSFDAAVNMPPATGISELRLSDGMLQGSEQLTLPVVRLEGISHVIVEPDSGFFGLKDDKALAETLLRGWCGAIGAECLGMMFLDEARRTGTEDSPEGACSIRNMTPLVYVPGADTMFWENSCASGTAAAGVYLAAKAGMPADVILQEPAGRLRVKSDPSSGKTVLYGTVKIEDR